ncbi:MAG: hypothetical protein KJO07_04850 [Deltaproteobacteria bacterium]|jgi:hypothetical protein|nr:hypothetical protein [Deltaproteobacteria bacterium]
MSGPPDIEKAYSEYLERFTETAGDHDFGAFVKHEGRLVKKLQLDEFDSLYTEYYDLAKRYFESLDRGDTINDIVVRMLRQKATELFLTSPV